MGQHQLLVKKLAALMEAARPSVPDTHNPGVLEKGMARVFNGVNTVHGEGLRCKLVEKEFASKSFAVMLVSQPPTLPELMDATLTRDQRKLANAALFPVFTESTAATLVQAGCPCGEKVGIQQWTGILQVGCADEAECMGRLLKTGGGGGGGASKWACAAYQLGLRMASITIIWPTMTVPCVPACR
jgi:hypothetical protein